MNKYIDRAGELKASGEYNCAQAVACAFAPAVGADLDTLRAATAAYGAGMGCMDGTCGAIVGAGMIIGLHCGGDRARAMKAMKGVMTAFNARNGATVCRRLKGIDTGSPLRSCDGCVMDAATLLAAALTD